MFYSNIEKVAKTLTKSGKEAFNIEKIIANKLRKDMRDIS